MSHWSFSTERRWSSRHVDCLPTFSHVKFRVKLTQRCGSEVLRIRVTANILLLQSGSNSISNFQKDSSVDSDFDALSPLWMQNHANWILVVGLGKSHPSFYGIVLEVLSKVLMFWDVYNYSRIKFSRASWVPTWECAHYLFESVRPTWECCHWSHFHTTYACNDWESCGMGMPCGPLSLCNRLARPRWYFTQPAAHFLSPSCKSRFIQNESIFSLRTTDNCWYLWTY